MRVLIENFLDNALYVTLADGSCVSRSMSALRVIEPAANASDRMSIVHDADPEPSSMWRDIGATYDVLVPESVFARHESTSIAAENLKIVQRVQAATPAAPASRD